MVNVGDRHHKQMLVEDDGLKKAEYHNKKKHQYIYNYFKHVCTYTHKKIKIQNIIKGETCAYTKEVSIKHIVGVHPNRRIPNFRVRMIFRDNRVWRLPIFQSWLLRFYIWHFQLFL